MIITLMLWVIVIAVIVRTVKDTVKKMCEEYDCTNVDFEKLIYDLDECEMPELWVEIKLLRGKYNLSEPAESNFPEKEEYIDESPKAC